MNLEYIFSELKKEFKCPNVEFRLYQDEFYWFIVCGTLSLTVTSYMFNTQEYYLCSKSLKKEARSVLIELLVREQLPIHERRSTVPPERFKDLSEKLYE